MQNQNDTIEPEIIIRGVTLKLSVMIESVIMQIIFFCSGELFLPENSHYFKTKYVSFGEKQSRFRELLKNTILTYIRKMVIC